jgi:hypothetical protein
LLKSRRYKSGYTLRGPGGKKVGFQKMNAPVSNFLHRLRKFVQDESNAQMGALEQQWSHPLNERVARGWAIEGLHVEQFKMESHT